MVFRNTLVATILCTLLLDGCATSTVQVIAREPTAHPPQVVLIESSSDVDLPALRNVFSPDMPKDSEETIKLVKSGMTEAEIRAMAEMKNALTNIGMTVINSEAVTRRVNELEINRMHKKLSLDQAHELHLVSGADNLLRFRITDYGLTPKAWRNWVIGFEVVSTVGIAAIAYTTPELRPLAGVYLVTEAVEETAEAYTGFWALDKLSRPVRIEAEMFDLRTGEMLWADSNTGLARVHLIRLATHIDAATRNAQLEDATHESVEKLMGQMVKSLAHRDKISGNSN